MATSDTTKPIALASSDARVDPGVQRRLRGLVASVLVGSPFERRSRWAHAVVVARVEERRVTSRADFSHWLAAQDLPGAARECMSRKIRPGCVLTWIDVDTQDVAVAQFVVVDVLGGSR